MIINFNFSCMLIVIIIRIGKVELVNKGLDNIVSVNISRVKERF